MISTLTFLVIAFFITWILTYVFNNLENIFVIQESFHYALEQPNIFIINLAKNRNRYLRTNKKLNQYGFFPKIFEAIDGRQLTKNQLESLVQPDSMEPVIKNYRTEHNQLSIGAIGCYLSHYSLWKQLSMDENHDYYIIFEDDLLPSNHYYEIDRIIRSAPDDFDILLLGGLFHLRSQYNSKFHEVHRFICLHAYVIKKTNALYYILQNSFPIAQQLDWFLSELSIKQKIKIYTPHDINWKQDNSSFSTDIQTKMIKM